MSYLNTVTKRDTYPEALPGARDVATLTGDVTLTKRSGQRQKLDPGGAGRNVTLPAVSTDDEGYWFLIANSADNAEDLTVKDVGGNTIGTVNQSEEGEFYVDSAGAWQRYGIRSYAAT